MPDTVVYLIVAAVVVIVAVLATLAFAKGWIAKLKIRHQDTEVSAESSAVSGSGPAPTMDLTRAKVTESTVRNRRGRLKAKDSKIKNSQIENGK